MSYLEAPATELLAISCANCHRPLLDARSAAVGLGPTCRKRLGVEDLSALPEEARVEANRLINLIARVRTGEAVIAAIHRLVELGLHKAASHLRKALAEVQVYADPRGGARLLVLCPYNEDAVRQFKAVPGWKAHGRVEASALVPSAGFLWSVPEAQAQRLLDIFINHFPGLLADGRQGLFMVPKKRHKWELLADAAGVERMGVGARRCALCGCLKRPGGVPSGWVYRPKGEVIWSRALPACERTKSNE